MRNNNGSSISFKIGIDSTIWSNSVSKSRIKYADLVSQSRSRYQLFKVNTNTGNRHLLEFVSSSLCISVYVSSLPFEWFCIRGNYPSNPNPHPPRLAIPLWNSTLLQFVDSIIGLLWRLASVKRRSTTLDLSSLVSTLQLSTLDPPQCDSQIFDPQVKSFDRWL